MGSYAYEETLAGRDATEVNAPWSVKHIEPLLGFRPIVVGIGRESLELDPADPADRAQMIEFADALLRAAADGGQ